MVEVYFKTKPNIHLPRKNETKANYTTTDVYKTNYSVTARKDKHVEPALKFNVRDLNIRHGPISFHAKQNPAEWTS